MKRTSVALALGVLVVGAAACSSTPSTTTTASTAAATTAAPTTAASSSSGSTPSKSPTVTKPAKVEKVDKAKVPTKAQKAAKVQGISEDESDCIDYVIVIAVTDDPSLAESDLSLAGLAGGAIVACVPQEKLATGITADIKSSSSGSSLSETQLSCIEKTLATADPTGLAVLIGGLAIEEVAIVQQAATELDATCGTNLAG